MPQMMPMNWILSFCIFILIFIMMNMLNYYSYNIKYANKYKIMNKSNKMHWKW